MHQGNNLREAKQLGLFAAIGSLGYIFWIVGGMELVERIAYYGVKASAGIYAKTAASEGGLGISLSDYGLIVALWSFLQTFVPVFTGGVSDRVGYKETIFASTILKICGYLIMAYNPNFWGFLTGAVFLATGTGIFKPGIQGTLALSTRPDNTSMAWGLFYQIVNIGGFLGPLVAVYMRQLSWDYVFFACAAIISLNFLFLFMYQEPGKAERLERKAKVKSGEIEQEFLWKEAFKELRKPIVFNYMFVFAGFWFMFFALFDVLPIHVSEWVDTSVIITSLFGDGGTNSTVFKFILGLNDEGTAVMPEGMVNINAAMIMTTCFLIAALSGKLRVTTAMFFGAILSVFAILMIGAFNAAWIMVFAIATFSLGEMLISPKKNEFMANIAPEGKKAMYLGFVMLPQGIGATLEGYFGVKLYEIFASKEAFSRELLVERGMDSAAVDAIPQGEAFSTLVSYTGETAQALTQLLYSMHNVSTVWYIIGAIGSVSAVGIYFYSKWLYRLQQSNA